MGRSASFRRGDLDKRRSSSMKARKLDEKFDRNESIIEDLDVIRAKRPGLEQRRVNVDFPSWVVESLDLEARRLGVTRQSVIKVWIAERLGRKAS
jgi:hypothetical protein